MEAESEKLLPVGDHWSRSEVDEAALEMPVSGAGLAICFAA